MAQKGYKEMAFPIVAAISAIARIGDKFIEDKDKRTEFAYKAQELAFKSMEVMLTTKTVPWVDATVKILYALKAFFRPVVGGLMTAFGAWAHVKGMDLGALHAVFDGAFPAWGVSRAVEKVKKRDKDEDEW